MEIGPIHCLVTYRSSNTAFVLQRATRSATAQERDQLNAAVEKLGMKGLHPHQLDGLRWMLQKEQVGAVQEQVPKNTGGLIADDMGLGKTRQLLSLTLATWTRGTDSNRFSTSTLIVCDLGLFKTWEAEISKAVGVDRLPYILFHKSATDSRSKEAFLKMDAAEVSKYPIVITNYEPFKNRRSKLFTCLNAISWRRIILDEASKVKNAETNAAINLKRLTAWSRWCCTATPVENKLTDLQAHFEFLRSPHAYAALFDKDPSNWTFNDEQILRDTILRRTKLALASSSKSGGQRGGELILPQLWETSVVHSLSDDEVDRIMEARNEAPNGLVKALREVQAIQTPGPEDPSGSARLNTLMALLKDLRKKVPPTQTFKRYLGPGIPAEVKDMSPETTIFKIVIFSLHKADLDHIAERLTALEKSDPKNAKLFTHSLLTGEISKPEDRRTLIDSFLGSNPNHETNILLSTLHIGATGLNLQKANVVILYGHWYNPAIEQQAIARVHRIGSTYEKVWCFDLKCTEGMSGVMDRMEEIKDGKMELARAVMEVIEVEHVE
ncbi:SNF2 family N-terminal domain-containing protein [Fimicolochytrium jonesii]|uniref:SNF2 family N-terminal domain-containing protein n=1 Tax=Fimicolochytrium jonesii TaxID=1396493 RepID=UPI0022FE80ED|nr:SNF2 family N-terminal domain-containing protein [Fimicolochytrium jonesii]KAI8818464.1 SNF2 family N-terminal domain-containing protein [Fimicolochytrium jonesii]